MKFTLPGLGRGKDTAVLNPDSASVTRISPARKRLGTRAMRRLMDRLTAQQASLVRSVAKGDDEYLNNSYYLDPETGKRIAHELEEDELSRFTTSWGLAPIECIRAMNRSIREITEAGRRNRYARAAVDLEIMMDQQNWANGDGKVYQGIPSYLMNGYTDMGMLPSPTEREGREKIKVDKKQMRNRLVQCKQVGLDLKEPDAATLALFYETVRKDIEFDEQGVEKLSREYGNESIVLSEYLNKGMGVCRHLSIFYQLYLQELGLESRVVKGDLRFYVFAGRHAWNLVKLGDKIVLADVTHPDVNSPFIVAGSDETEVYKRAQKFDRTYVATPDEQNYYKIGI
jgi:hypothetical protein